MSGSDQPMNNQEILHELLLSIVEHIYRAASESADLIRETAVDENPNRLKDRLVELQGSVVDHIFSVIDGGSLPTGWPEIKLVNADTGESLCDDLAWEMSRVEGEFTSQILSI